MPVLLLPNLPKRHLAGLLLAALWLGWTVSALSALATPRPADSAVLAALTAQLHANATLPTGQPLAVRLPGCACAADDGAGWLAVTQALQQAGGQVVASTLAAGYELLVFDVGGGLVYAGPLRPPASVCGRRNAEAADWLPALLGGTQPPLLLSPSCSCRD